ncbi:hypothetical protein CR513_40013, partial [Mucuna pruriens]
MSLSETESESSLSETNLSLFEIESEPPPSETDSDQIIVGILHALCFYLISHHDENAYQIGIVTGDTSSFMSLCAKSDFMSNPESSSNILHELGPKIDRTIHRLRNVRSVVVILSVSNSDNSASATNESDYSEYSSSDVNSNFYFGVSESQEPEPMENND